MNFKMRREGALRLGPDTAASCSSCCRRSRAGWQAEQVLASRSGSLRVGDELNEVEHARLLGASRGIERTGTACSGAAIRSSFVRICPGTMYATESRGLDFLCRAVPFRVIGGPATPSWQFSNSRPGSRAWTAKGGRRVLREQRRARPRSALSMMRIYEITSAIVRLQRVLSQSSVDGAAAEAEGIPSSDSTSDADNQGAFTADNLFRAFWMVCRFACVKAPAVSEVCRQSEASTRTVERACDTSIRVAVLVRALSNDLADGSELQASGDPWRVAREIIRGLRQKKRELACGADGSSTDDQFNKCVAAIINFIHRRRC